MPDKVTLGLVSPHQAHRHHAAHLGALLDGVMRLAGARRGPVLLGALLWGGLALAPTSASAGAEGAPGHAAPVHRPAPAAAGRGGHLPLLV